MAPARQRMSPADKDQVLQLSKLEILDVSKNRITAIPEDIKKLTSLKFLAEIGRAHV